MPSSQPPSPPAPPKPAPAWQTLARRGHARLVAGDAEAAATDLAAALELEPAHSATRFNLAAAHLRSGNPAGALQEFDRLLETDGRSAAGLHGRGLALLGLGERDNALAAFRRCVAADPLSWKCWASIADTTPDESERLAALAFAADALRHLCAQDGASPSLLAACADALGDAHRYIELAAFAVRHAARFTSPARSHDLLAKASYECGAFEAAFLHKQAALLTMRKPDRQHRTQMRPFRPDAAVEVLKEITGILKEQGAAPFLAAGTLLGFYRSGGPLSHDRDIDIGVLRQADGGPDIAAILRRHPNLMLRRSARVGDRYFAILHRGIAVDIFVHDAREGRLICGVSDRPGDIQWRFTAFALESRTFDGLQTNVPDHTERYLCESYGPAWKRPDRGFASAISSPALFEVSDWARAFYAAARARSSRLLGDTAKARALAEQSPVKICLPPSAGSETEEIPVRSADGAD